MARPLRIEYPGAVYHVTARGNAQQAICKDDGDRYLFLEVLVSTIRRYNWLCHAYCLMDNHYHLLLETPDPNLSQGMRQLNGVYTQQKVAEEISISQSRVSRLRKEAINLGYLDTKNRITEDGKEYLEQED